MTRTQLLVVLLPLIVSAIATANSVWGTTDPNAVRTPWQSFLLFLKLWSSGWAPEGYKGLVGRVSIPFLHLPKIDGKMTLPPAGGAPAVTLIFFSLLPVITGSCGLSWANGVRVSLATLERAQGEAARVARAYNVARNEELRAKSATVKSLDELAVLRAEATAYEAKFSQVVNAINKLWAATAAVRTTLPLAELAADPKQRTDVNQWIAKGLAELLVLKDLLSVLGAPVGGV